MLLLLFGGVVCYTVMLAVVVAGICCVLLLMVCAAISLVESCSCELLLFNVCWMLPASVNGVRCLLSSLFVVGCCVSVLLGVDALWC